MQLLGDPLSTILARQMDACTLRQRVIANNIANVNTPGFKKSEVNFQQQLKEALGSGGFSLRTSSDRHIGSPGRGTGGLVPTVVQVRDTSMRAGKNNVDIDEEMVNLAANTILYRLVTMINGDRANTLSYVIRGGK
ncbi:flagellar basal body rod protein FlgB [Desulfallas sp. Bu1-1]|uniref:flagellar basal body rod protein FlgB n=1 Tax=Desulfallas sp. Bu1-1 TaxID=2787620 RepID=UPI00189FCC09|nr:flagellar basal body rod protein FlgB [Desulfallas sp. Bu1-1]MBF7081967.1 flagellar basal body rod protein FlgB [Desulfallas sp. Bu1-1]